MRGVGVRGRGLPSRRAREKSTGSNHANPTRRRCLSWVRSWRARSRARTAPDSQRRLAVFHQRVCPLPIDGFDSRPVFCEGDVSTSSTLEQSLARGPSSEPFFAVRRFFLDGFSRACEFAQMTIMPAVFDDHVVPSRAIEPSSHLFSIQRRTSHVCRKRAAPETRVLQLHCRS